MSFANVIGVVRVRAGLPSLAGPQLAGDGAVQLAQGWAAELPGEVAPEPAGDEAELSYG